MLRLDDVTVRYPEASSPVLRRLSLHVRGGSVTGVHAPSGSGKSTLLKTAALLLPPSHGRIEIDGQPVGGVGYRVPTEVRNKIGIVFQSPRASTDGRLPLRQIIATPLSHHGRRLRPRAAEFVEQISALADRVQLSEDLLDRLPHQVSDGQLQRACLARALALDPRVLICDEPTSMLDAPTTAVIMRLLVDHAAHGAAVLIASHDRRLLDVACDVITPLADLMASPG